jgi:mono/diheme cytochrome c family protein
MTNERGSRRGRGFRAAVLIAAGLFVFTWVGTAGGTSAEASLAFVDAMGDERVLSLSGMRRRCEERVVEVDDPYHAKRKRYVALALGCVLDLGFGTTGGAEGLRNQGLLLRALDGYTRPVSGSDLLEADAYLAFGEPERMSEAMTTSRFSKIDRQQVDPSPFYLVWTGREEAGSHDRPWPYQLARIEIAPFEKAFPRTVPSGLEKLDSGWPGYTLFKNQCASCHSINGQGGKVGPDLNVPLSIVEYRPIPQIRGYIRNPAATRYTSMPAHPNLSEADLDALIAYFSAMSERKHDPRAGGAP